MPRALITKRRSARKGVKAGSHIKSAPSTLSSTAVPSTSSPIVLLTRENSYQVPHEIVGSLSMYWYYAYRHRSRWWDSAAALQQLGARALNKLGALGISAANLADIGRSGLVEVRIPFVSEEQGWAARVLPWEFLLRVATGKRDLVVIRHLEIPGSTGAEPPLRPKKLLFVQSAPGELAEFYSFNTERWLVKGSLGLPNEELSNPTSLELQAKIGGYKPDIIHLAGVDLHEGDTILEYSGTDDRRWDGFYMASADPSRGPDRVDAKVLGSLLNPQAPHRALIACNFFYSAARVAAMAVANGAEAAIGFQDEVDNALAERFFASFYQRWRTNEWKLLQAFVRAWTTMAMSDSRGAGVVFWTRRCLIKDAAGPSDNLPRAKSLEIGVEKQEVIKVEVEPNLRINYSSLHNGAGLFRKFCVYKYEPKYANGIQVRVSLNMGTESFPYEASFDLGPEEPVLDIAERVNLPLTSQLARSLRESVQTSLGIRVVYNQQELYNETHRVTLLPVNEWEFDEEAGARWLGSFVLPGDPAIRRVIDTAQKYLMSLRDDSGAGFDGYQSTGDDPENPDEGVDMQVRALWSALSFEFSINYINPPPVFTVGSQRLRTPSDVIDGHRGTCIDLALLFAACLEYIDINPVVFVLSDHAFPGYWRNERAYNDFLAMHKAPEDDSRGEFGMDLQTQNTLAYEELRQFVRDGVLVPLETVWLTSRRGFGEAVEAGVENLRTSDGFEALLNIRKIREENVTPLPVCGEPR